MKRLRSVTGWHPDLLLLVVGCAALASCSRVQYVPVETVRRDSVVQVIERRDSIHVRDSVAVWVKGDTVHHDRWRTVYKEVARRDTVYKETRDTVQVPYPVERAATWWDKASRWVAGLGVVLVLGAGLVWMLKRVPVK